MEKTKILVVDDEPSINSACVVALKLEGYEVDAAETGQQGLDLMKSNSYSLFLLDIVLPDMTGIDILKQAKIKYPKSEAIIMTANPSVETVTEALKLGAYDYIAKPFNIAELGTRVKRCLLQQKMKTKDAQLTKQLKEQVGTLEESLEERIMELRELRDKFQQLSSETKPEPQPEAESKAESRPEDVQSIQQLKEQTAASEKMLAEKIREISELQQKLEQAPTETKPESRPEDSQLIQQLKDQITSLEKMLEKKIIEVSELRKASPGPKTKA